MSLKQLSTCFILLNFFFAERIQASALLDCIQSFTAETIAESHHQPLWEVHSQWIQPIIEFVQTQKDQKSVVYPDNPYHPIFYFDRQDARHILKPIVWNLTGLDLSEAMINHLFLEKIPAFKEKDKRTLLNPFLTPEIKQEVYRIALETYKHAHGEVLFVLGQTPAYVGEMLKSIDASLAGGTTILHIPFSGRPNYVRKLNYKSLWATAFMDLVTAKGKARFLESLKQRGFSPSIYKQYPKKIFILDNSSGASVTCFLALLQGWFEEENIPFPEIVFLELCEGATFTILRDNGKWMPAQKPDLRFDDNLNFDIPVEFLGMQDDIVKLFDKVHDNLRIVPSYNAIHWSKEYLDEELRRYPTPEAKFLMQEYYEYAMNKLFAESFGAPERHLRGCYYICK